MEKKSTSIDPCHIRLVLQYAVASRLLVLTLMVLWRSFLSPYDTSASINPSCLTSDSTSNSQVLFPRVASALEDSIVWDSVYFVRIAQCGYEYEQSYAFLPLLPICISFLSQTVFAPFVPLIGQRAVLALSGYMLNNIAFVFAALYLYRLSVLILNNTALALRASILFCLNPASIFYSSIYSESLYALLSVGGLYNFMRGANNTATLWFALSGVARSNGSTADDCFGSFALLVYLSSFPLVSSICISQYLHWTSGGWNEALVQGKASFSLQLYSKSLLGSGLLEIFPRETVAELYTCIPNIISSILVNRPLRETMA